MYLVQIMKYGRWMTFYRTDSEDDAYNRAGYLIDCENAPAGVRIVHNLKIIFLHD